MQLNVGLVRKDCRWNCYRSHVDYNPEWDLAVFYIDTNPAITKYKTEPWASSVPGAWYSQYFSHHYIQVQLNVSDLQN